MRPTNPLFRRARVGVVAGALALAVLGAACGDDASSATADGPAASVPTSADSGTGSSTGGTKGDDATVSFPTIGDGQRYFGGLPVVMEANGVDIEPAGEVRPGSGHFHVIVDKPCVAKGQAIPRDAEHLHFGKGQTEAVLYLPPGELDLCLQVGDGVHAATEVTRTVRVVIGIESREEWCAVAEELDEVGAAIDGPDRTVDVIVPVARNAWNLTAQLRAAMGQVGEAERDALTEILDGYLASLRSVSAASSQSLLDAALGVMAANAPDPDEVDALVRSVCGGSHH